MKKTLFSILLAFAFHICAFAQAEAPVITELHMLLKSAQTNFVADLGPKIDADSASKAVYYDTQKKAVKAASTFIVHQANGQNMYVMTYDAKGDKVVEVSALVDQYIDELNKMLKSGNYTGEDYKGKSGMDVTDIKDKAGNVVLRYTSNTELQRIYIYGFVK